MAIAQLKWPWLGILIPSFLISFIGYCSHLVVFRRYFSLQKQIVYEMMISMIWLSYYLAIVTPPGSPPENFQCKTDRLVWSKWCKKCANYKPERCHHCKTCKTCVLEMDHHCPWTMNCVGYENMPHFLRFLIWVELTTAFTLYELCFKIVEIYQNSDLPLYLFNMTELSFVIVLTLVDFFVLFTITILLGRVVSNHFFSGMTQIEVWEYERLESQMRSKRMWKQINRNHYLLYGKNLNFDKLVSANNHGTLELEDEDYELRDLHSEPENSVDEVPQHFTVDDIVFPYDISIMENITNTVGPIYLCWWPWAKAPHTDAQNGLVFKIDPDFKELDQLGLPWPPDGGDQLVPSAAETAYYDNIQTGRNSSKRVRLVDPRLKLKRTEWFNDFGEKLSDFGVDLDAEEDELIENSHSSPLR